MQPPPEQSRGDRLEGGRRRTWALYAGVAAVYFAIAVIAYLPILPLDNSHTQICTCGDISQEVWFLGWVPFALGHGLSPFFTNWILFPRGVNLMDNTAMPLLGLAASPVTALFGPVAAYNLILRAGFALSGLAMFAAVRPLVRWWPASFFAGLFYGFCPFIAAQGLQHEFLVFSPIPPLAFLLLTDVLGEGRRSARRSGMMLGLLFVAQMLIASEVLVMMLVMAALGTVAASFVRRSDRRAWLTRLKNVAAWCALVVVVLGAYPIWFFLAGPQHVVGPPHPIAQLDLFHGDLLGAFLPTSLDRFNPFGLAHTGSKLLAGNLQENGTYLGAPLVALCAALVAAYRRVPVIVIAAGLALASYLLCLGGSVSILNHATGVPGPFALLARLPVVQDIEPARLSLMTDLFVAVVLGVGIDRLRTSWLAGRGELTRGVPERLGGNPAASARSTAGRSAAVLCLGALVLLPVVPRFGYHTGGNVTPGLFLTAAVDRIPAGSVVATFPYPDRRYNEAMTWQAQAGMRFRILGATTFFVPGKGGKSYENWAALGILLHPSGLERLLVEAYESPHELQARGLIKATRQDVCRYHIDTVIVDGHLGGRPALATRWLERAIGAPVRVGGVSAWFGVLRRPEVGCGR